MSKTAGKYTREQIELIKSTVGRAASLTDNEFSLFIYQAQRLGLDPLLGQVYPVKRRDRKTGGERLTIQVGIDGYRSIAARTGEYAGNDDAVFDDEKFPQIATVTVWRIVQGVRYGFSASARWSEYYPGKEVGFMWDQKPHIMLAKCAEALALRKAFPSELSGVYTAEEMEAAGPGITDHVEHVDGDSKATTSSEEVVVPFGQSKGTPIKQLADADLDGLVRWCQRKKMYVDFTASAMMELERRRRLAAKTAASAPLDAPPPQLEAPDDTDPLPFK